MSLSVELEGVGYAVPGKELVADLSFTVEAGRFACIIGASGCGKSTLLSLISGLLRPTAGELRVGGKPVGAVNPRTQLVFQDGAVFPWLTVEENVAFGLRAAGLPADVREGEVHGYLRLVGLDQVARSRPHELSGGMRQRVAIARALVMQPQVLLLDEPFSALDAITRANLQVELLRLWEQTGVTILFVTHNLREAIMLADDIHLMGGQPGRLEATWSLDLPRGEREHHPSLRPLEADLGARLKVAHPAFEAGGGQARATA
jgi:NitT/TauT family transport system ATP-binding protein